MPKDTVSLFLDGDIQLEDLFRAVSGWRGLMRAIGDDVAPGIGVHWRVDELSTGSFYGTLKGVSNGNGSEAIERVVCRYEEVGRGLRDHTISGYPVEIRTAALSLVSIIGERVRSVRFETDDSDSEISVKPPATQSAVAAVERRELHTSYGSLRGRVQTISNRTRLRFMLYEASTDRAVTCYLGSESEVAEQDLGKCFGKSAAVEGTIRRDPVTGNATTIRNVRSITIIPPLPPGAWRRVRGMAPALTKMSPEDAVRAVRDG